MKLVFELTMPHTGSWNNRWSGQDDVHVIIKTSTRKEFIKKFKELDGKCWEYRWDDGWCACITAKIMPAKEAEKLRKRNCGFCGYSWMVDSIMEKGRIERPEPPDPTIKGFRVRL